MRGLWRVIALMAEDANSFDKNLATIATQVTNSTLLDDVPLSKPPTPLMSFKLTPQPTSAILQTIDTFLRSVDKTLRLTAYELAEVNRIVCEAQTNEVPPHKSLKAYWTGLGNVGPDNRPSNGFMEAVGGLSGDSWTRSQFAARHMDLTGLFDMTSPQQEALRSKMVANSPSDLAATNYSGLGWPHKCASVITMSSDWIHFNA